MDDFITARETCPECGGEIRFAKLPAMYGLGAIRIMCECEAKRIEEEEARQVLIERKNHIKELRKTSGMPLEQQKCTLDNFNIRGGELAKHLEACKYYAQHFSELKKQGKGILFTGSVGSGKTHLAAGIANYLINEGWCVKYAVVTELLQKIQATFNNYNSSTESITEPLKTCPLLVLDDLGAEKPSEWTMNILHSIIDSRYSNYRPTIITTNLTSKELVNALSSRTVDRILDKNKERFIKLNIAISSYRQVGKK